MKSQDKTSQAREKILKKAEELFYTQGYQATGINQIIAESGVAKATFYSHFPSKEDLCLSYVKTVSEREIAAYKQEISKRKTPLARFLCLIEILEPWLEETGMKGCAFLNLIPEVVDARNLIRKAGAAHYAAYEEILLQLAREMIASEPKKYAHLKAEKLMKDYMAVMTGAIALSELYHSLEPIRHGIKMIKELVK